MAIPVQDGTVTFRGGQNSGALPDRIGKDEYHKGINITTKQDKISPRPGFVSQEIKVVTEGGIGDRSYAKIFRNGKFQSMVSYDTDEGEYIVFVISGVIFRVNPQTKQADVLSLPDGDRLNQYKNRIPWSYAGRFLVLFDYPNLPVIIDGNEARRANPERESSPGVPLPEIPVSTLGAFVNNRLWVANASHEFGASDPVGGINPDAPTTFEESMAPAGAFIGQFFSLGTQSKNQPITAMGFLQVSDTSTGIGPLLVATKNSIYAFRADTPRAEWENIPFGRIIMYNAGIDGHRALVNVNSDLFSISNGQVRSLAFGQNEQSSKWANTPVSRGVEEYLKGEDNSYSFCGYNNNRVFFSGAGYRTTAKNLSGIETFDYAHKGIVVLELDNISTMIEGANPAWAGIWTGINPMDMCNLSDGAYFFSKDPGGVNRLYFLDESISHDVFEGEDKNIVSRLYTREYDFQSRFLDKENGSIDYTFSNVSGEVDFLAEYRASSSQDWKKWGDLNYHAKVSSEKIPKNLSSHNFGALDFGDPEEEDCDEITDDLLSTIRKMQLRLTLSGKTWSLEEIRLMFHGIEDSQEVSKTSCENIKKDVIITKESDLADLDIYSTAPSTERGI